MSLQGFASGSTATANISVSGDLGALSFWIKADFNFITDGTIAGLFGMLNASAAKWGNGFMHSGPPSRFQCYAWETEAGYIPDDGDYAGGGWADGVWSHCLWAWDRALEAAADDDGIRLWIDTNKMPRSIRSGSIVASDPVDLHLGTREGDDLPFTNGKLAGVAVLSAIPTSTQLAALASGAHPIDAMGGASDIAHYWPLDSDGFANVGSEDVATTGVVTFDDADNPALLPRARGRGGRRRQWMRSGGLGRPMEAR